MTITDIQKLKDDTTKSDVKVSEILRRSKILASNLNDTDFLKWIENELNGYSKEPPAYRLVNGEPKGWNPYHGWVPAIFTGDQKTQKALSEQKIRQSVSELEDLVVSSNGTLQINYPPAGQDALAKAFGMNTQYALMFPTSRVVAILDTIRNKIIDWLIKVGATEDKSDLKVDTEIIFPSALIERLPSDIKLLTDDFNFNFSNGRAIPSMLILRRLLPLAVVRRFQQDGKELEIKNTNGEYLETKTLLGKAQSLLSNTRTYNDIMTYKILTDATQHSYTLTVHLSDARGAGVAVRVFLDEIFKS